MVLAFVRGEHDQNLGAIQPGRCADVGQDGGIANVAPFVEIGGEQPLDDLVLLALLTGQPNQAMGVEVFGVRSILSWLNTSPSGRPAAATCASSAWECCQDPNLAER